MREVTLFTPNHTLIRELTGGELVTGHAIYNIETVDRGSLAHITESLITARLHRGSTLVHAREPH